MTKQDPWLAANWSAERREAMTNALDGFNEHELRHILQAVLRVENEESVIPAITGAIQGTIEYIEYKQSQIEDQRKRGR